MRRIAVVLFALAVMCVSGEPPVGKKAGTVPLGSAAFDAEFKNNSQDKVIEKFEVYEDWDRGYLIYKQTETFGSTGCWKTVTVAITAVPIRTDWPPKQTAEKEEGK